MSILFITSSRIGDAVISSGVLEFASRTYPDLPVVVACGPLAAPLFEDWPNLERIIEIRRKPYSMHWFTLWQEAFKRRWQWIIDIRGSGIGYGMRAKKRSTWRSVSTPYHRVEQMGQMFKLPCIPHPTLHISKERQAGLQSLLPQDQAVIAVAPVANWFAKEWPEQNFIDLLKRLTAQQGLFPGAKIAFFASPAERARVMPMMSLFPENQVIDLVGRLPLLDIYGVFQKCTLFVGNDSGLMHLAAAAGVPTMGLFGPSPDIQYAPYGPRAAYVRTPESNEALHHRLHINPKENLMTSLSVDRVEEAIDHFWYTQSVID
ncbi:MAG: glycosyltransferase family 9 protein [Janthinobacterium lividum]